MENKIVGKDMICPITNQHCDDECCMPGSKCNLSGNSITPGFRMYYFTESKWYGPLPFIKLPIEEILNFPSGDSLIPEFAGMVKEENKDFVWRWFCKTCTSSIDGTRNCSNPKECGPVEKTAVPVAEEIKTQPKKLIMDKEVKMVVSFPDHFRMVLKAANGDTFTTKSEELMDFISSCETVVEEGEEKRREIYFREDMINFAEWINKSIYDFDSENDWYDPVTLRDHISTSELLTEYLKTKQ